MSLAYHLDEEPSDLERACPYHAGEPADRCERCAEWIEDENERDREPSDGAWTVPGCASCFGDVGCANCHGAWIGRQR